MIKQSRENFRMGATQLKISGGGGVSSMYDDLDVQQYTFEEIKIAVDVAKTYNAYMASHIFSDEATPNGHKGGKVKSNYTLSGIVIQENDILKITIKLLDNKTGFRVLNKEYKESLITDAIYIEDLIANRIALAIDELLEIKPNFSSNSLELMRRAIYSEKYRTFLIEGLQNAGFTFIDNEPIVPIPL